MRDHLALGSRYRIGRLSRVVRADPSRLLAKVLAARRADILHFMLLRDRLSPETRLKTGWLIPVAAGIVAQNVPGPDMQLPRRDELLLAGLLTAGVLVGILWQWYSPRAVGDRLLWPALSTAGAAILFVLPGGETHFRPALLLFGVGIVTGVVLTDLWHPTRGQSRDA